MTACLLCLTPPLAFAEYDNDEDSDCPGDSCDTPPGNAGGAGGSGGDGGDGGEGGAGGDGGDASASNFGIQKTYATGGDSESSSYSRGGSASNFGIQEQDQDNDVTINNPAADVEGAAKRSARRASQAARVTAGSNGGSTPCGDHTGLSLSTGVAGGGLGTITEACRAFRATQAEATVSAKKAFAVKAQYWIGFPFRLVLHVVTLGVLN